MVKLKPRRRWRGPALGGRLQRGCRYCFAAHDGEVTTSKLAEWSVSCRSCTPLKIDLFLRQQGLDTTTPAGKAMFQMMGVFAEFERAMIQERVRAGLARARGEGKRLGRAPRPRTRKTNPRGSGDSWEARCPRHCQTIWSQPRHSAANQPPFRAGRGCAVRRGKR